ncbi:MAG: PQQ-dependent sugar dehydrogenase [Limisphaerales bacterium]
MPAPTSHAVLQRSNTLPANDHRLGLTRKRQRPRKALRGFVHAAIAFHLTFAAAVNAAVLPAGFAETALVTSGLPSPTSMEFAPDGRLFICQQPGQLRVVKNGVLLNEPFLTVTVNNSGERGLLGVAFDPDFASNRYVYVYYTATSPTLHNRVSRFTANGDVATPGSEVVLLDLNDLGGAANHNGGAIHFGTDGKLYVAVGENANTANSQTLGNLLGKMLRINRDGTIPTDNPFYNATTGVNRSIWSLGLRNPFTFAIHPVSGRILINDVGENAWEEINDGVAGANYGWPLCEGPCNPASPSRRDPIFAYPHGSGTSAGFSITGGAFYAPQSPQFPASYVGTYFFADYVNGWIRVLDPALGNQVSLFATGISRPVDLKVGPDGLLYYLGRGNIQGGSGFVYAIRRTGNQIPQIVQQPVDQTVEAGEPATFSVVASRSTALTYQWRRGTSAIAGASSPSYTLSTTSLGDDNSVFRCVVANSSGSVTSNPAILHVTSNRAPVGSITLPGASALYSAGEMIGFSGSGTDLEDGTLPASAFSWVVVFHHDTHTHPFMGPINGVRSGSFVIPTEGETSANVWYRIHLTVTDSGGLTHASFVDVRPRTSRMTLATVPAGLRVTLDGQPMATPVTVQNVVGITRHLGVVSPQTVGGETYTFDSWSDGGAEGHTVTAPATDATYTAAFVSEGVDPALAAPSVIGANDGAYTDHVRALWSKVAGATHYQLARADTAGGPKVVLSGWMTRTSFDDTTGLPGVVYYYSARAAADGSGTRAGPYSVEDPGWRAIPTSGGNSPPTATSDAFGVASGGVLSVPAPGVLGNDTDVDGDSLSALLVEPPAHGVLSLNANGSFEYAPESGFVGSDTFSYRASDGQWDSGNSTVSITVGSALGAPAVVGSNDGAYTGHVRTLWSKVPGATHYQLSRAPSLGGPKSELSDWITGTSFDDTTGIPGFVYYYSVRAAADDSGAQAGANSIEDSGWRAITPPSGVVASDGLPSDRINISWNSTTGATHYRVSRSTTVNGSRSPVSGWLSGNTHSDTAASPGVTYYYSVQGAANIAGQRPSTHSVPDSGYRDGAGAGLAGQDGQDPEGQGALAACVPEILSIVVDEFQTVRVQVYGREGCRFALEASEDGVDWTLVGEEDAPEGSVEFTLPVDGQRLRFFRALPVGGQASLNLPPGPLPL